MTTFAKLLVGWTVWSVGTLLYARSATYFVPPPQAGSEPMFEVVLAMMAVCYLVGVPILTGVWIHLDSKRTYR